MVLVSLIYWALWGIVLIPLTVVTIKHIWTNKSARDKYTILAMSFLWLTLAIRAATIVPLLLEKEGFEDEGTDWERAIFSASPLLTFLIAAMINTYRWYEIGRRSIDQKQIPLTTRIICQIVLWTFVAMVPISPAFFCITKMPTVVRKTFLWSAVIANIIILLVLIFMSWLLIYFIATKMKSKFPFLYLRMKVKMFVFLGFIIFLLVARMITFVIIFVLANYNLQLVKSFQVALVLGVTEMIPCILILASFVLFAGQNNKTFDSLEGITDSGIQNPNQSFSQTLLFGKHDSTVFEEEDQNASISIENL